MSQPETVTGTAELSVGEWTFRARVSVPAQPTSLRIMLPVIQQVANGLVNLAVRAAEEQGKAISCKAGCGACCRQLVPITEVEARQIREVVEAMPEPRRSAVRERFAEARRHLEAAGLLERLEGRAAWPREEFQRIGMDYFRLGIACPFLEEESCSVHPDRPITCREYLDTSPAENCAAPTVDNIDWVPLPVKVWRELARFDEAPAGADYLRWVPLILAPEWAEANPAEPPPRTGPEWMQELFGRLSAHAAPRAQEQDPRLPGA